MFLYFPKKAQNIILKKKKHIWSRIKAYYLSKYTSFKIWMLKDDSDFFLKN